MYRLFIIFVVFIVSCDTKSGLDFVVYNKSELTIDSIIVKTSGKYSEVKFNNIPPVSDKSEFLDMTNEAKVDGDYWIQIVVDSIAYKNRIGYYTNGSPVDKKIEIWFSPDSIRYKETRRD